MERIEVPKINPALAISVPERCWKNFTNETTLGELGEAYCTCAFMLDIARCEVLRAQGIGKTCAVRTCGNAEVIYEELISKE